MGRLFVTVALGALLAGTAAQAQIVIPDVQASQNVRVSVPGFDDFTDNVTGSNGKLSGFFAPNGTSSGNNGGAYDTFVTTTPATVSFEAASVASGPRATSTSTTQVDLKFSTLGAIANGSLESTITPAGFGFYVANIGSGSCLYSNCSSDRASPFSALDPTSRDLELGSVSVSFQILLNGRLIEGTDFSGSMTLYREDSDDGFAVDTNFGNLTGLDGFGLATNPESTKAFSYAWAGKDLLLSLGELAANTDYTISYLTTVTSSTSAACARNADCLLAFAGFGDPVGRGGGIDSADEALTADLFSLASFADPWTGGSVLDGPNSNASGPIGGVNFSGATFKLPTFDQATGRFTFVAVAAVPEPSTWAVMILGFGAVGTTLRRRRAQIQGKGVGARA